MSLVGLSVQGKRVTQALTILLVEGGAIAFDYNGSSQEQSLDLLDRARSRLSDDVVIAKLMVRLNTPLIQSADQEDLRRVTEHGTGLAP